MRTLRPTLLLYAIMYSLAGCQVWLTDANNTPSAPTIRADRTVFEAPADTFDKIIPPTARQPIPNSAFSVATVPIASLAKLRTATAAQTYSQVSQNVGWPATTDLWSYHGNAAGQVHLGAKVLADKSLHLRIEGNADTDQGDPNALRGHFLYDGPCDPQKALVFYGPMKHADTPAAAPSVFIVAYQATELSPVRQISPTWSLQTQ